TGYSLYVTQAFARTVNPDAVLVPWYLVRLRGGAADVPRFQAQARALGVPYAADVDTAADAIQASIRPQVTGWWILAGLAALAGIVVIASALARQAAVEAESYATLSALGVTRPQRVALGMATTLIVAVGGAIAGVALAFALSPLTPVGEARLADPSAGFAFDVFVLLPGAAAAVAVVLALGLWPAIGTARVRQPETTLPARASRIVALLARAGAPPSMLIGARRAVERGHGRTAVPVGPALLGSVLAVTALCATAVFGASLGHLIGTPALYGQPFDLWLTPGSPAQFAQLTADTEHDSAISDISIGGSVAVSIDGRIVQASAGRSLRGPVLVTAVNGHLPAADDQVAMGAATLRQLGAHVGSLIRVTAPRPQGPPRTAWYQVTGTIVFPPDFGTGGLGAGAVFTLDGLLSPQCARDPAQQACQLRAVASAGGDILVRAVPGPRGQAALSRLARAYPGEVNYPVPPTNLVNFGQAVNFPALFGLAVTVFGVATLMHVLAVSVARRRREAGLLKALGFVRRQVASAVSWQTTIIAAAGILVGVPAGVAGGRLAWRAFADGLGVLPVPIMAAWVIAAVAAGTLLAANTLALGPALAAARAHPAALLRAE
ncbi:MAG: FtsX-like permease family protein, partial [Streptosporangiaceae bacterium]|nr:FtsX-like permease family protein [Streptosporangiaceae bacterium]